MRFDLSTIPFRSAMFTSRERRKTVPKQARLGSRSDAGSRSPPTVSRGAQSLEERDISPKKSRQ